MTTSPNLHSSSSAAPGVTTEQLSRSHELVLEVELVSPWPSQYRRIAFKVLATGVIAGLRFNLSHKQIACKLKLDVRPEVKSSFSGSDQSKHSIINILACNHSCTRRIKVLFIAKIAGLRFLSKLEMLSYESVFSPELVDSIKNIHRCSDALQHFGGLEGLASLLHTDLDKGLAICVSHLPEDLAQRKQAFGENIVYPGCWTAARKTTWTLVKEVYSDKIHIILVLFAAALSLGFGIKSNGLKEGWYEGASIIFEMVSVFLVTAMSNHNQSRHFRACISQDRNTKVVRCGQLMEVPMLDVVVGDIVELRTGDRVPADGFLIQGDLSLAIDESNFSRESHHYLPQKDAFIGSGTKVQAGSGTVLITAVGINTEWGHIMDLVLNNSGVDETPLQACLSKAATLIRKVGLSIVTFILSILFIVYFTSHWSIKGDAKFQAGKTRCVDIINALFHSFSIAVNIVVVALPEGLPDLAVTLTLAYFMHKMMVSNALVRRLADSQTMGSATTICSALTMNKMTVVKSWIAGKFQREEEIDAPLISRLPSQLSRLLFQGIAQDSMGNFSVVGPAAQQALLTWAGVSFQEVREESNNLQVKRFHSAKKSVVDVVAENSEQTVLRGAAEIILSRCHKWVDMEGNAIEITTEKREEFKTMIADMASCSLQCVAFAYCDKTQECPMLVAGEGAEWQLPEVSNQLTLSVVVGMKYPWKTAVNAMKEAGLTVRMVTGDNLITANATAKECGILEKIDQISLEADTLSRCLQSWTPSERTANFPNVVVVAKALPFDKLFLVENLKSAGEVVAFIGNGASDAPALHKANIGLSMEVQGTELAKENSDIMILHDDFTSLIKLVHGGRSLYFNIQKCLQFHFTVNMVAVVVNLVVAVTSGDVSLTTLQLLWVNLIISIMGAFALATEALDHELMPQRHVAGIITYPMWRNLVFQVIYQVGVLLTLQFHGVSLLGLSDTPDAHVIKHNTIFNTFVLCQLFNEVNTRQPYRPNIFSGMHNNSLFMCTVAIMLILQIVMVEFLERIVLAVHMHWQQWLVCITLAFLSWPVAFLGKVITIPKLQ